MAHSRVYGVDLRSVTPLTGFVRSDRDTPSSFTVWLPGELPEPAGEVLRRRDEDGNVDGLEVRRPSPESIQMSFSDGASFLVDVATRRITGAWRKPLTLDDALVYLVGPVLGAAVRLSRRSILHASAVQIRGQACALMGEAGAGKSTLTAALVDSGCPLVTEDVCAIDFGESGAPFVSRGATRVKLWPKSVEGLRGREDALPLLVPASIDWHKRYLDCADRMCRADLVPLGAIVKLERSRDSTSPEVVPMRGLEKVLALLGNAYGSRLVRPDDRAHDLARLTLLANRVPVVRLTYPDRFDALPNVVAALRDLVASLARTPADRDVG